jgi:ABC-type Fe3+-hydroxamate transport system substrate-binding protein
MPPRDSYTHKNIQFDKPPQRVVSLVPSLTESLFELGFGPSVVGITDYCLYPQQELRGLPRLGGPKTPRLEEIIALNPDLVLANKEENPRQIVEALEDAGVAVWVTFPKTVRTALDVLWVITGIFQSRSAAIRLETLELTLDWARDAAKERTPQRYFCPIWSGITPEGQIWWMTFNLETYCHDLLKVVGGENVFATRQRRYPLSADINHGPAEAAGERDVRYPRVTPEEVLMAQPEIILLPSEPYEFSEVDRDQVVSLLIDTPAVRRGNVHFVDGSLITWHGTRMARALRDLPELFAVS